MPNNLVYSTSLANKEKEKITTFDEFFDWMESVFRANLLTGEQIANLIIDSITEVPNASH